MNDTNEVVNTAKMLVSVAPVGFTVLGLPIETWSYIVSISVGLFYLIEKFPAVLDSIQHIRKRFTSE